MVTCGKAEGFGSCLPDGLKLNSEISERSDNSSSETKTKPKTLESKLIQIKAKCKNGKLTDGAGKEIRIVQLIGCWGNPPEDYQEQLDRQQEEIKQLREKYTVIEVPCTPNRTIALQFSKHLPGHSTNYFSPSICSFSKNRHGQTIS
jgi:hypothetical protein